MESQVMRSLSTTGTSAGVAATTAAAVLENDDDRHMLPCRFFAHGYCHKGIRCRFYHPTPVNLRSSIRVPPLPPGFQATGRRLIPIDQLRRERILVPYNNPQLGGGLLRQRSNIGRTRPFSNLTNQYRSGRSRQRNPYGFGGGYNSDNLLKYADGDWDEAEFYNYHQAELDNGRVPLFIPPPPQYETSKNDPNLGYNTIFKHIKWSDFLAPGQLPPVPTCVPVEKDGEPIIFSPAYNAATRQVAEYSKGKNLPEAEGDGGNSDTGEMPGADGDASARELKGKKLTAKQELHVKVREIARELANEPKQPINSLNCVDSYFHKYKLSDERAALLIAPDDISRIARENKIVHFQDHHAK